MNIATNILQLLQHTQDDLQLSTERYMGVLPFYHIVSFTTIYPNLAYITPNLPSFLLSMA